MSKREQRDSVKDPDAKEMHAYENDVSVLWITILYIYIICCYYNQLLNNYNLKLF